MLAYRIKSWNFIQNLEIRKLKAWKEIILESEYSKHAPKPLAPHHVQLFSVQLAIW